jgi:DinB family protein
VRRLTEDLDDEALERRTAPDQWSVAELTCHLWRVQQLFEERLDAMLTSDEPSFESYAPENDPDFSRFVASHRGGEAVAAWLDAREQFARRLDRLTPDQWRRTARHPTFARFDVEFLIEYMGHHEAHHVYQIFMRRLPLLKR